MPALKLAPQRPLLLLLLLLLWLQLMMLLHLLPLVLLPRRLRMLLRRPHLCPQ